MKYLDNKEPHFLFHSKANKEVWFVGMGKRKMLFYGDWKYCWFVGIRFHGVTRGSVHDSQFENVTF
jgi:hypothetical protein